MILAGLTGRGLRDRGLVETTLKAITGLPGLEVVALELEDCVKAVELMERHNLDYEDSLHLATAMRVKAEKIVSNDRDFDRTSLKRVFQELHD